MSEGLFREFDDLFSKSIEAVLKDLPEDKREKLEELKVEDWQGVFENVTDAVVKSFLKDIRKVALRNHDEDKQYGEGFERRLFKHYKNYFVSLHTLIGVCTEAAQHYRDYFHELGLDKDSKSHVDHSIVIRLHARALRTSNEISTLLQSGYATGALARWRALHETVTTIDFLTKNPEAISVFLDHNAVASYKAMSEYDEFHKVLKQKPFTAKQKTEAKKAYEAIINKYDKDFKNNYGWLKVVTKGQINNFRELDEKYGQSQLRPYYRYASYGIHPSVKSLFSGEEHNALVDDGVLLIGASDSGFEEVAQLAPISLAYATILVLNSKISVGGIIMCKVIRELEYEVMEAYSKESEKERKRIQALRRKKGGQVN